VHAKYPLNRRLFRGLIFSLFFTACDNATNREKLLFKADREMLVKDELEGRFWVLSHF